MCSRCNGWYGEDPKNFRRGGVDVSDFDDELRPRGHTKTGKGCKKSKTREPCKFTVRKVISSYYSKYQDKTVTTSVMTCERCGKHSWRTYGWR